MTSMEDMKEEVAYFMRRLYTQKLTTTSGGNISMKLSDGTVLITPSGSDKGRMKGSEIGRMDLEGDIIGDPFKPTIESRMHLEIYKRRPDVTAVVHAHPPCCTAFASAGAGLDTALLAEAVLILGRVPLVEYGTPSTEEVPEKLELHLGRNLAFLLSNHGALTLGQTAAEAADRMETLEFLARVTLISRILGGERPLNEEQLKKVLAIRGLP